jgi:hypothetical protein
MVRVNGGYVWVCAGGVRSCDEGVLGRGNSRLVVKY